MTSSPRILLLERDEGPSAWPARRFDGVARQLAAAGFEATLATVHAGAAPRAAQAGSGAGPRRIDMGPPSMPLVCGRGRAGETEPLRTTYGLAHDLADAAFDAIIAPLRGGIAHGLLMRRATEARAHAPVVALWCDRPSRALLLDDDHAPPSLSPLVADALERSCLRLADLLLAPSAHAVGRVESLGESLPPAQIAPLPDLTPAVARAHAWAGRAAAGREIVLVGPLTRANGALLFMDAVEELARSRSVNDCTVTFLGPAPTRPGVVGQQLLGVRAASWTFRFQVLDIHDAEKCLEYLAAPGRIAIFAAGDCEDDRMLRAACAAGCSVIATGGYDATRNAASARNACAPAATALADAISSALERGSGTELIEAVPTDWPRLMRDLCARPRRTAVAAPEPPGTASICIVHRDRHECLRRAVASVPAALGGASAEIVVVDNAGAPPLRLEALPAAAHTRIVRVPRPLSQQAAINKIALDAAGDVLIFLDDDNVFADRGVERFLSAFASGWFDVVVSTLDLVDGDPAVDPSSGRFIFLGDAGMAGLFFNGFGDTAMAVRRRDFLRLGGFTDPGHGSAALDWVFLAKARAAGLRIGVLHEPAVRYARSIESHRRQWRKQDAEGARRAVAEAYGAAIDGPLLARFAQALQLELG